MFRQSHMGKPKYNWRYVEFSLDWKFWCDTILCWYGWSDMIHFFGGYYTIVALALLVEPPCTQLAVKQKNTQSSNKLSGVPGVYVVYLFHSYPFWFKILWSIVQFIHLDMSGELWDGNQSFPKLWGPIDLLIEAVNGFRSSDHKPPRPGRNFQAGDVQGDGFKVSTYKTVPLPI